MPKAKIITDTIKFKRGKRSGAGAILRRHYIGNMTRETIRRQMQALSNKLENEFKVGSISISLQYPDKFLPGNITDFGAPISLPTLAEYPQRDEFGNYLPVPDDPINYPSFYVYIVKGFAAHGGASANNDCLYNCIDDAIPNHPWSNASAFKKYLGLNRNDVVPLALIPKVEAKLDKLQIRINITGDHIYTSPLQHAATLEIKLVDGHYSINKSKSIPVKGISFTEKMLIIYDPQTGSGYDGEKIINVTKEMILNNQSIYHFIKHNDYDTTKATDEKSLINKYNNLIEDADLFKEVTNGKVNIYKTGKKQTTILDLWTKLHRLTQAEEIKQDEAEWIRDSTIGALTFAKKGEYKDVHNYDIRSSYQSMLSHNAALFPVKRGNFKVLKEINKTEYGNYDYGIYRVNIERKNTPYFRYTTKNKYTHDHLYLADKLGLKWELVQDGKVNALQYMREHCITGYHMFKRYIDFLYPLKEKKIKLAKLLLNALWGTLTQSKVYKAVFKNVEKDGFEIYDDTEITMLNPTKDEKGLIVESRPTKKSFSTNYARILPFILGKGRRLMYTKIEKYIDNVVWCHTDGFMTTQKLPDSELGAKMGGLKYEGHAANIVIGNLNNELYKKCFKK
jgi:hypothetical protein